MKYSRFRLPCTGLSFCCLCSIGLLIGACSSPRGGNLRTELIDERDQQVYAVERIGSQTWMAENLKVNSASSYCYDNDPKYCESFGRLYTFEEAQVACPYGWKLPSDQDWKVLEMTLGMRRFEADSIRVWRGSYEGEEMKKRLKVVFSGMGKFEGRAFTGKGNYVYYWVNSQGPTGEQYAMYRMLQKDETRIYSDQLAKKNLACVRCLKSEG